MLWTKKIHSSLTLKLTLPILGVGLVLLIMLVTTYNYQANKALIRQFQIITKNVSDSLVIATETDAKTANLFRIVGSLAARNNLLRLVVIEQATNTIIADNHHQNIGMSANKGLGTSDYMYFLRLIKSAQDERQYLVKSDIFYNLSPVHMINPNVNRLRKYYIFIAHNKSDALNQASLDLIKLAALFACGILAMFFTLYQVQLRVLLKPLRNINQTINQPDRLILPTNEKHFSTDELGIMATNYNELVKAKLRRDSELTRAQRYIEGITEASPMLLAYVDAQRCYQFVNKRYKDWFQKPTQNYIGQHMADIVDKEIYRTISHYIDLVLSGESVTFEKDLTFGNMPTKHIKASYLPDFNEQKIVQGFFICIEDITDTKNYEIQLAEFANNLEFKQIALEEKKRVAEEALKIKSEFLASMSHEIRTPMNGVLGMLTLLMDSELTADQIHKASLAKSSAESLLTLINDILDFSKIESGKIDFEDIDFDLPSMLGNLTETFGKQTQDKGVELILDTTQIEFGMVKGDPSRIRQVLTNLVSNAIKFTHHGEIVITASLYNDFDDSLNFLCEVKDTGIGIQTDKLDKVFESFTQVDASTTRKYGGTGLGLTIAKRLCQQMGGDLHAQSDKQKGSCFKFTIKLLPSETPQASAPNINLTDTTVIVVDHNKAGRQVLSTQLIGLGAHTEEASCGTETLRLLETTSSDQETIVFIDMQLTGMSGIELARQVRKNSNFDHVKLIAMIHLASSHDKNTIEPCGFHTHIFKPLTEASLRKTLTFTAPPTIDDETNHETEKKLNSNQLAKNTNGVNWPTNTRILLVEDILINQLIVQGLLGALGLSCDTAVNGLDALKILKDTDQAYDIVFMDCQMPEMDGYKASEAIRQGQAGGHAKSTPIIAMTANAMKGDEEKCLASGMNDYLSKPIDPAILQEKLVEWLINRH
jgi:signal transduction histidine kinase/PleD family two-component response regulator